MSRFFSVLNSMVVANAIDDKNVSTVTSYSSYEVNKLISDLSKNIPCYGLKEYPANSSDRADPQDTFETPDSTDAVLIWVLREGVKMTLGIDYVAVDNTHIKFNEEVLPKYTVSILVIGGNPLDSGSNNNINGKFTYYQETPSLSWNINHRLSYKYPNVLLVDNSDNKVEADISYIDEDNCTINFDIPFAGKCICSV